MKFAMNTLLFAAEFTEKYFTHFKKFKEMGFDGVEFALADKNQFDPTVALKALKDNGLACTAICGMMGPDRDLRSADKSDRETGKQYIKDCIDVCVALECDLAAGPFYSSVGRANQETAEAKKEQFNLVAEGLKEACAYAEDKGVYIALEPLNRFETDFMNTCGQALDMIEAVKSPILGIHLDTFHMNIEEKSSAQAVIDAGDRLYHVHASENDRGTPGTGQVHWSEMKDALVKTGYDKWVAIESFTPDNKIIAKAASIWRQTEKDEYTLAGKGLDFLKQLFA
jgi:D-psicose/D-tagatose/L-ribulose 3-epimerase